MNKNLKIIGIIGAAAAMVCVSLLAGLAMAGYVWLPGKRALEIVSLPVWPLPFMGMAYQYLTALDLAKINGTAVEVGLIEEQLSGAPEIATLPARVSAQTSFKALVRTAFPTGAFRPLNQGVEPVKSTYVNKTFEMFYFDAQLEMDKAAADEDERGAEHALQMELDGAGYGFTLKAGSQVWYGTGTGGDAYGFPGAVQIADSTMVVDAGGTTASTAASVYAIVAQPKFFELLFGKNKVVTANSWRLQTITRSSKEMTAWKNSVEGWVGAAWYNKYSVGRIKKLTADSGKGLTDALLAQLIAKFPIGIRPTHLFMSRRSRQQLQISRTVTLFGNAVGGSMTLAPTPTEYEGIPIVATDSLLETEALTL